MATVAQPERGNGKDMMLELEDGHRCCLACRAGSLPCFSFPSWEAGRHLQVQIRGKGTGNYMLHKVNVWHLSQCMGGMLHWELRPFASLPVLFQHMMLMIRGTPSEHLPFSIEWPNVTHQFSAGSLFDLNSFRASSSWKLHGPISCNRSS